MLKNEITRLLKIEYPIIQAPMAGGITTSKLVAAVSNSGALGMIGAGYLTPAQLQEQIKEVKQLTSECYGVNLFVPNFFEIDEAKIKKTNQLLSKYKVELNIQDENILLPSIENTKQTFMEQIQIVMEEKVPICSFTFGVPSKEVLNELSKLNIISIGTATTVKEAILIEELGMNAVVVQGSEAGGHRGNFLNAHEEGLIGLMSLIPQVVDHVKIPVIAAGGIMDGRGLMASLSLGACAVQMGTAFLTCEESGAQPIHKEAILEAKDEDITLTNAFSGKWARGIKNKFIIEMHKNETDIPIFPIQNTLTQSIRKISSDQHNKEFMSLWSGQSPLLARTETAEALIQRIIKEAKGINISM
ncbi:nitronate monooxygenase family protein [Psychrobacillus sp. FJAT-21963]|uniref:NAD(P)H-dependent flavin oxidoreductase n=1 Tax=Psychrobacillus sp. FJAT-21963 TaxID=1712028 RepID=UPI0006FF9E50|nr:nitronate monooxygenase [Psychrobacillus sp. FJAT-21963]KQL32669.1 nitronate monooxygenase [Psychrobacillus sp. FJAT-21963]